MQFISRSIISWYNQNKRDLPWRTTGNPYHIWLSEIILQQTRIEQGTPYYLRFIEKFPTIEKLANASEEEVLFLWQGLGYYSRARNLHFTARVISNNFKGKFPVKYSELIKLKGIGDYTASAIASIAAKESCLVMDGNVFRLFSRYFGFDKADNQSNRKLFKNQLSFLLKNQDSSILNQAMMDLGSLVCKPQKPQCEICPLSTNCFAKKNRKTSEFPVKSPKKEKKVRFLNYLLIENGNTFSVVKRTQNDIWSNLFEFLQPLPLVEKKLKISDFYTVLPKKLIKNCILIDYTEKKHQLTHLSLHITISHLKTLKPLTFNGFNFVELKEIKKLPFPVVLHKYLKQVKILTN